MPICIKYQDENNNILGVDMSLSWKFVLELKCSGAMLLSMF